MTQTTNPPEPEQRWDTKVFHWGLGLMLLGLVGLALPTFGLQLHRLRALGNAQWMVLMAAGIIGSGAVLWSQRRRLPLGGAIVGCGLPAMLLFAWLSFWRHPPELPAVPVPGNANAAAPSGAVPLLKITFEGARSNDDLMLLFEFVKDCLPTATRTQSRVGGTPTANSNKPQHEFGIGPVPDVPALVRELRIGTAVFSPPDQLRVQVKYPLPARSQAFEKRVVYWLAEIRSNELSRQMRGLQALEQLEPVTRREEVVAELMTLLAASPRPINTTKCLAKWGTATEVPAIVQRLHLKGENPPELLDLLLALSPDTALKEAMRLLPEDMSTAERTLTMLGPRSEPAVLAQAGHANPQVRQAVCRVLLRVGSEASLPALETLKKDSDRGVADVAQHAVVAVEQRAKK